MAFTYFPWTGHSVHVLGMCSQAGAHVHHDNMGAGPGGEPCRVTSLIS